MADRFWIGTGNWADTANWSATSGGAGGAGVPTASDDAYFDAASGNGTCTVAALADCNSLTFTGFTGTLAGNQQIQTRGHVTLSPSTMTWSYVALLVMMPLASTTVELRPNGASLTSGISFFGNATSTIMLMGDITFTASSCNISQGKFDANGYNVTATIFGTSSGTTLWMRGGIFTATGSGNAFACTAGTLDAGTSTVRLTNNSTATKTINISGNTLNKVENVTQNTGIVRFTTAATINSFDIAATGAGTARSVRITAGVTLTLGDLKKTTGTGHSIASLTSAAHTLSRASGTTSLPDTMITWSNATGGATWLADPGRDGGNNTGWQFTLAPASAAADTRAMILA